ncbi:hypothetical protein CTI12_AA121920 [Artemisia annua]|uniref:Uncharacterized protein n=1 Tax=Artemisia annua TaxID=35608 RepID=A0A2U1PRF3_ARTAN|nr:hypothetical protein CTI12_AA121920 [Artemisia annua]
MPSVINPDEYCVSNEEMKEREKCEEREMMRCLDGARINCREFAENKCVAAFPDAKVVVGEDNVVEMIDRVCFRPRTKIKVEKDRV